MPDKNSKKSINYGFSMVELLVVLGIFSFVVVITTQSLIDTLRGSRKSESIISVKENLNLAFSVMERQVRNAQSVEPCSGSPETQITFKDASGVTGNFSCVGIGAGGYITWNAVRLTSDKVDVTSCEMTCVSGGFGAPPYVRVYISAKDAVASGAEGAEVSSETRIMLRTY